VAARGGTPPPSHGLLHLNQHAVAVRYPEEEIPPATEAEEAARLAEELVLFVRDALDMSESGEPGGTPPPAP